MTQSNVTQRKQERYDQRQNSRKFFVKNQLLTAKCETIDGKFSASVQNLSPGGAFIFTKMKLTLGQEIAMTIQLPSSDDFLMVTGKIIRISSDGYGVKFKIIFNE